MNYIRITVADISDCGINLMYLPIESSAQMPKFRECAKQAGYLQIELEVVAENASAVRLYESVGFQEYGRNPRGFRARSGWQTLVLMRLELDS